MGGLPERERETESRRRARGRKEGWIKESVRLEGCRDVVAEGRVERQKEEGKAGQKKGQDKQCGTNGNKSRLSTVKRKRESWEKKGKG